MWNEFDFAVVVANTGTSDAMVTVTGPNALNQTVTVPATQLVEDLLAVGDQPQARRVRLVHAVTPLDSSALEAKGAYHLVSSVPVVVYQFSALEYGPQGGPSGKDWSSCTTKAMSCASQPLPCFSYSNDASLLLPSTALTGNYRVTGWHST